MIDVLFMGGTWSPAGDPVTEAFVRALSPERYRVHMIEYPADYGQQMSYSESKVVGMAALARAVAAAPGHVLLAGYSQGAGIAGDLAAEIGTGYFRSLRAKVSACALIADPLRPHGQSLGTDPGGYGIAGQRRITGVPAFWIAAEGDPITALSAGSPLRSLADITEYWCLANPAAFLRWWQSLVDGATQRRWQRWWTNSSRLDVGGTLAWARGYLVDGRHTTSYVDGGLCARLAAAADQECVRQAEGRLTATWNRVAAASVH